ncbi:MAG: response regulator [Campylobacterales bacterium]|nr:response regulator [Campylobacterales bacterium]
MEKTTEALIDTLVKSMNRVSKSRDRIQIKEIINGTLAQLMDARFISFLLLDQTKNELYSINDEEVAAVSMVSPKGLLGNSYLRKAPAIYNYVKSEKLFHAQMDNPRDLKIKSQLIYPLIENDDILGIVRFSRSITNARNFTNYDLSLLKSIDPYLLKLVHLYLNDQSHDIQIDQSEVNSNIKKVQHTIRDQNAEINDTMLFLANTVHDIRTPANSLYGFLELMEERIDDPRLLEYITGAKESAAFIHTLTDSILDRVKHENEMQYAEPVTVRSVKYFSSIANIFTANMTSKNIHYLVSIDPRIPKEIRLDTVKLKRVLINLIGNAYKFTPTDKTIEFRVVYHPDTERLECIIEDQGLGIPQERQQEIFKAFEQAKEDTSIHYGGTGLGLAISSNYVEDLGGRLELESQEERGSRFYFDIPVEVIDAAPSFVPLAESDKKVMIYTDDTFCIDANNIKKLLVELGMSEESIYIGDKIKKGTTHLFCFEHKFNDKVVEVCQEHTIKLAVFEEKLFSLSNRPDYKALKTIAKNTYYGDTVFSTVSSLIKPKVLIVDDNKVNIKLLESILEGTYCEISYEMNPNAALEKLKSSLAKKQPYDVLFLDKHMPELSGTGLLREYRSVENGYPEVKPIYSVSITGDVAVDNEEKKLFNEFLNKPFKSSDIRAVFDRLAALGA